MLKKIRKFIAPFVTILALYIIFRSLDIALVMDALENSNKLILILSSGVALILVILFLSLRLKEAMSILGCKLRFKEALKIYLAILPASKLSPANTGDFIRSYYFKDSIRPSIVAGSVFFERVIDILVISLMAMISGALLRSWLSFAAGGLGVLVSALVFFVFKKNFFIKSRADETKSGLLEKMLNISVVFNASLRHKYSTLKILLYTLLNWLTVMFYITLIFYALDSEISILSIMAIQPIVSYASFIPITISGIGARESMMLFLYKDLISYHIILSVGLIFSLFTAFILPLTGLPLMYRIIKNKKNEQR